MLFHSFELQFSPLQNEKDHSLTPGLLGALSEITYEKRSIPSKALLQMLLHLLKSYDI